MTSTTTADVRFGDRKIGEAFQIDTGGNKWLSGQKVGIWDFRKESGEVIKVSYWTKTK